MVDFFEHLEHFFSVKIDGKEYPTLDGMDTMKNNLDYTRFLYNAIDKFYKTGSTNNQRAKFKCQEYLRKITNRKKNSKDVSVFDFLEKMDLKELSRSDTSADLYKDLAKDLIVPLLQYQDVLPEIGVSDDQLHSITVILEVMKTISKKEKDLLAKRSIAKHGRTFAGCCDMFTSIFANQVTKSKWASDATLVFLLALILYVYCSQLYPLFYPEESYFTMMMKPLYKTATTFGTKWWERGTEKVFGENNIVEENNVTIGDIATEIDLLNIKGLVRLASYEEDKILNIGIPEKYLKLNITKGYELVKRTFPEGKKTFDMAERFISMAGELSPKNKKILEVLPLSLPAFKEWVKTLSRMEANWHSQQNQRKTVFETVQKSTGMTSEEMFLYAVSCGPAAVSLVETVISYVYFGTFTGAVVVAKNILSTEALKRVYTTVTSKILKFVVADGSRIARVFGIQFAKYAGRELVTMTKEVYIDMWREQFFVLAQSWVVMMFMTSVLRTVTALKKEQEGATTLVKAGEAVKTSLVFYNNLQFVIGMLGITMADVVLKKGFWAIGTTTGQHYEQYQSKVQNYMLVLSYSLGMGNVAGEAVQVGLTSVVSGTKMLGKGAYKGAELLRKLLTLPYRVMRMEKVKTLIDECASISFARAQNPTREGRGGPRRLLETTLKF